MADRLIIADAGQMSPAEFKREVFGDSNDITGCPMAAGYFLRDGAWMLIKPHHYWEHLTDITRDTDPQSGNERVAA